eukprot:TRINITY_DN455_c0_g1_i1.p1 TRINITY_DN455_c0_g1~~TRINITY_DN455_c0_g1_i1.p1  ORF type:complete len:154 (+),score=10.39 TRINITY_DN455_c0_g1_i1:166-627(+)
MSWQSYVDDHLMCALPHGGALKTAAIVGQDGAVWAQSAAFPAITPAQVAAIVEGFDEAGKLAEKGLWIGDEKFMVVQGDPGVVIRGRNKEEKEKVSHVFGHVEQAKSTWPTNHPHAHTRSKTILTARRKVGLTFHVVVHLIRKSISYFIVTFQ